MNVHDMLSMFHPGDYCPMMGEGMMGGGMMEGGMMSGMMSGMMNPSMMTGAAILWMLMQLSALILIILLIIFVAKSIWGNQAGQVSALEALKLRYAEGDIAEKDYKQMKRELGKE